MATYYEIIVKGDSRLARAYVSGYFRGRNVGRGQGYGFGEDSPLDLDFLRDLVKFHGSVLHMFCEASLRSGLLSAIRRAPKRYRFEVVETRRIRRAYFRFRFKTANRQVAGRIKRLLSTLPDGVKTADYEPKEIVDPSAEGAEIYTPVHEYVFRGKGVIEGTPDGVYQVHRRMVENDFISCDSMVLHYQ